MIKRMMRRQGSKTDNRGVAMMVCITIIAILMIFCFSLLSVCYSLYSSQNNSMQEDKNAEAAKSLDMSIREDLTSGSEDSFLAKYLRYNIVSGNDALKNPGGETWPHYDPDKDSNTWEYAKRYFRLEKSDSASINGFPSSTSVCMWWTCPGTSVNKSDYTHLFVEVECRSGSQSYVIRSEYELREKTGTISDYAEVTGQTDVNPAGNLIDRRCVWIWKYLGSE